MDNLHDVTIIIRPCQTPAILYTSKHEVSKSSEVKIAQLMQAHALRHVTPKVRVVYFI
jgi:hypothetical protein